MDFMQLRELFDKKFSCHTMPFIFLDGICFSLHVNMFSVNGIVVSIDGNHKLFCDIKLFPQPIRMPGFQVHLILQNLS